MKRLLAAVSTAVVAAVVYLALSVTSESDSHPGATVPAAANGSFSARPQLASNPGSQLPERQWQPGMSYHYAIEARRAITLNGAPAPTLRRGLDGALTLTVIERDDALIHVRVGFSGQLWQKPKNPDASLAGAAQALVASYGPDGRLEMLHAPAAMSATVRDRFAALLSELQLSVPDGAGDRWEIEEMDTGGEYLAVYERAGDGSIERTKAGYVRVVQKDGLALSASESTFSPSGAARITVGAHGWPSVVHIDDSLTVETGQITVAYAGQVRATLRAAERADIPALDWNRLTTHHIASAGDPAARRRGHDRNRVQGKSYGQVSGELQRIVGEHGFDAKHFPGAQSRMAALFRLDPSAAARAGQEARTTDDENYARALISSLGQAGTAEAQSALLGVLEAEETSLARRRTAAIMTAVTRDTTADTLDRLAAIGSDNGLYDQANLALGGAVNNAVDGVDTGAAVETLLERYAAATSDAERTLYMEALGNTGDRRALPLIQSALASTNGPLRRSALGALRFIPGQDIDILIAVYLTSADEGIRRLAMSAALRRENPLFIGAFVQRLQTDPVDAIRLQAIRGLSGSAAEQEVSMALQAAASSDPSADVRTAAANALAGAQ